MTSITVITPTIGGPHLASCVRSVNACKVQHLLVVDGEQYEKSVRSIIDECKLESVSLLVLPENTGADGWNGHRIYSAVPTLCNTRFVAFLDDDNEVEPDHFDSLERTLRSSGADFAYSLRMIIDAAGNVVCPDACESLGGICKSVLGDWFIDTSCYLLPTQLAVETAHCWRTRFRDPSGVESDRLLSETLLSKYVGVCSMKYSLRYRVGNTPRSVKAEFFQRGNAITGYRFGDPRIPVIYVFHFDTFTKLSDRATLINGYEVMERIPRGASVFVHPWVHDDKVLGLLAARTDLRLDYSFIF